MTAGPYPGEVDLDWENQYRIIPSRFPPVNFFEAMVDPALMDELFYIESLTNDRLRQEAGEISLVPVDDRISGPGSTPLMAAFTHSGCDSRFSDGSFGIYYAANSQETAIAETRYHRAKFLNDTNEDAGEIDMRVYIGEVVRPMHDIRSSVYDFLHHPDDYKPSQAFGLELKQLHSWGLVYRSVRRTEGLCIAALRAPAISIPRQGPHLSYYWDGKTISEVFEKTLIS
ncbi:MAG: RES family NAD+ phosphorylase [Gammaproteobacteria bacterium]